MTRPHPAAPPVVLHLPPDRNPYQDLLCRGLAEHGVVARVHRGGLVDLLRRETRRQADILHLHWLHKFFAGQPLLRGTARSVLLVLVIALWRLQGKRIVWTVHNISHHEGARPWLDRSLSTVVAWLAHRVVSHSGAGQVAITRRFRIPRAKVVVAHHGNYLACVPPTPVGDGSQVRFLFFGQVRPYKGVEDLLEAFSQLSGNVELRIVGNVRTEDLQRRLEHAEAADSRLSLVAEFVPDEVLHDNLRWCSVVVLPFARSFSSGSLLYALSSGRPVVLPNNQFLREYISDEATITYGSDEDELLSALQTAMSADLPAMGQAALELAQRFDWHDVVTPLLTAYGARSLDEGAPSARRGEAERDHE